MAILVFMGGFDYECGFLLKETIFSSCGSSTTTDMDEKGVETTYSLKEM